MFPLTAPDGMVVWVMIASMILPGKKGNRIQYVLGEYNGSPYFAGVAVWPPPRLFGPISVCASETAALRHCLLTFLIIHI